jgi:glycerol-3-phosphate acyltransferase PlsY
VPDVVLGFAFIIAGYFAGSFPTARIIGMLSGHDHSKEGSGNPGASNVYRTSGAAYGLLTFFVDAAKGFLPVLATLLVLDRRWAAVVWVAATAGHILPFARFLRGGKGVATGGGGSLPLFPFIGLPLLALFLLLVRQTRTASIGSLVITVLLPIGVFFRYQHWIEMVATLVVSGLILLRHRANIKRLVSGSEHRVA